MKKGILVVEDSQKIRNILVMHIESELNAEIYLANEIIDAYKIIKENTVNMIVANYVVGTEKSSLIYSFLKKNELDIPFVLITEQYPSKDELMQGFLVSNKNNAYFKHPITEQQLVEHLSDSLKLVRPSETQNYKRIRGKYAEEFVKENMSIYILDEDNNYIEMSDTSSICSEDDFYFVPVTDYRKVSEKINEQLITGLSSGITQKAKLQLQYEGIERIHFILGEIGLSQEEIRLGEAVYNSSAEIVKKNSRMSQLLGNMMKNRKYTYELSMMCSYLTIAISRKTPWHSQHSMKKLSLAAIFQDISLEDDKLALITDIRSPEFEDLSDQERDDLINHPVKSVEMLAEVKEIEDVCNNIQDVVLAHHERPVGQGFPQLLPIGNLSSLSCLYIIAHEFSHRLVEKDLTLDTLKRIQVDFERDYSSGRFRIPYESFLEAFKYNG